MDLTLSGTALDSSVSDYASPNALDDLIIDPVALSNVQLAGQMDGVPGGTYGALSTGGFAPSDGTGMSGVAVSPHVNPNPTGGWMTLAQTLAGAASSGFKAFAPGSPSVAIPRPRTPNTGLVMPAAITSQGVGGVKWSTIGAIGAGVVAVILLVHYA